jgi:hypothetical protein
VIGPSFDDSEPGRLGAGRLRRELRIGRPTAATPTATATAAPAAGPLGHSFNSTGFHLGRPDGLWGLAGRKF